MIHLLRDRSLVVTLHGHDVNVRQACYRSGEYGFWQKRYSEQFALLARQPNVHFIVVSNAILQAAIGYGVPKDRVVVHYIGIDVRQFQLAQLPRFSQSILISCGLAGAFSDYFRSIA